MFQFGYVFNELRRRLGRTILTALGLAAGVGLVIGIIGVSQGLDQAQAKVLAPLSSIGTDVLVTRVVGAPSNGTSATPTPSASAQTDPRANRGFFPGGRSRIVWITRSLPSRDARTRRFSTNEGGGIPTLMWLTISIAGQSLPARR